MKWRDGELFIAGLSNQDFASTLRRIKYPFDSQQSVMSVEIYHAGHNLMETRAPIRAMSFATLGGKAYLVAAYTCTLIVILPLDEGMRRSTSPMRRASLRPPSIPRVSCRSTAPIIC